MLRPAAGSLTPGVCWAFKNGGKVGKRNPPLSFGPKHAWIINPLLRLARGGTRVAPQPLRGGHAGLWGSPQALVLQQIVRIYGREIFKSLPRPRRHRHPLRSGLGSGGRGPFKRGSAGGGGGGGGRPRSHLEWERGAGPGASD